MGRSVKKGPYKVAYLSMEADPSVISYILVHRYSERLEKPLSWEKCVYSPCVRSKPYGTPCYP